MRSGLAVGAAQDKYLQGRSMRIKRILKEAAAVVSAWLPDRGFPMQGYGTESKNADKRVMSTLAMAVTRNYICAAGMSHTMSA